MAFEREEYQPFYRRSPFWHGVLFCAGFYGVALVSYHLEPDWMWMYYVSDVKLNGLGFFYLGTVLYLTPFFFGFALGFELKKNSFLTVIATIIGLAVLQGLVVWELWERYWWVGTRAEFEAGKAVALPNHQELGAVSFIGGLILLIYLLLLGRYYWKQRWKAYQSESYSMEALYPAQTRVVQALGIHMFEPIETEELHEKKKFGRKFSQYISSMPWINQVGLSLVVELVQILPPFLIFKPRFFTSLSPEEKDRFLNKMEHSRLAAFHQMLLVLKTMLSLLYYEKEEVFENYILANASKKEDDQ